jgi:hypothetical protein
MVSLTYPKEKIESIQDGKVGGVGTVWVMVARRLGVKHPLVGHPEVHEDIPQHNR